MAGLHAMQQLPDCADEIADAFGITETLQQMREKQTKGAQSYVYLIDTVTSEGHYFKIGKSIEPHVRLKNLRTGRAANMPPEWEGHAIRPLALRLGGLAVESSIHSSLRQHRLPRTEWFTGDTILPYIAEQDAWNHWSGERPHEEYFVTGQRFTTDVSTYNSPGLNP